LQLELNEQETAVLRRKVEELEKESESSKRQVQDLQEKLSSVKESPTLKKSTLGKSTAKDPLSEKKIQVMEDEINELRKKVIEKDREFERIQAEQSLTKGKLKIGGLKTK
jgi:5-methylcytosine-specific restriction endonuclease McrBC regulatory subunit McrC